MANYTVTAPDGTQYDVTGPEGATREQLYAAFKAHLESQKPDQTLPETTRQLGVGVLRGGRDVIDGGAELLTHGLAAGADAFGANGAADYMKGEAARVDKINKDAEAAYEAQNPGYAGKVGRVAGNLIMSAPLTAARLPATLPRAVGMGTLQGAATGALMPTASEGGDVLNNHVTNAVTGATVGGLTGGALAAAARVVSPMVSPAVRRLLDAGVTPTTGQIMGGGFNRAEEALASYPLVGDSIRGARTRALESYNRAVGNEVLQPLGQTIDPNVAPGRDLLNHVTGRVADHYNATVPNAGLFFDPQYATEMQSLMQQAQGLGPERFAQFQNILRSEIGNRLNGPGNGLTGASFKDVESSLGTHARDYRNSVLPADRHLGDALLQAQLLLRQNLARSNPQVAGDLEQANAAYSRLLRMQQATGMQGATAGNGGDPGMFTPAQFSSAVRQLDPTLRKSGFARGTSPMQGLSDDGSTVLGNKVPDSGTPFRIAVNSALTMGASGAGAALSPPAAIGLGSAIGGTIAAYSRPGQAALRTVMTSRPAAAGTLAELMRGLQLPSALAASSTQPQ